MCKNANKISFLFYNGFKYELDILNIEKNDAKILLSLVINLLRCRNFICKENDEIIGFASVSISCIPNIKCIKSLYDIGLKKMMRILIYIFPLLLVRILTYQRRSWLEFLVISKDFRGRGIGSAILRYAENQSTNNKKISLFVFERNKRAINFYLNHGYRKKIHFWTPLGKCLYMEKYL